MHLNSRATVDLGSATDKEGQSCKQSCCSSKPLARAKKRGEQKVRESDLQGTLILDTFVRENKSAAYQSPRLH